MTASESGIDDQSLVFLLVTEVEALGHEIAQVPAV